MKKYLLKKRQEEPIIKPASLECFPDFTKKEIFTQGELINELLERYIRADKICFDYLKIKIDKIKRIYVVGSGVNYSCAVFGAYNFEVLLDIISVPVCCGEFVYSNPILDKTTLVVLIGDDERVEKRALQSGARLVRIADFSDDRNTITLNYKTLGAFPTAAYTLRLSALALLALYLGEKNQVITTLYVKIATQMLCSLSEKIKHILSQEYIINEISKALDFEKMIIAGTNVDYALSAYASIILSDRLCIDIPYASPDELTARQRRDRSVFALASNMDFYNLLDINLDYQLKLVPKSVNAADDSLIYYDESIPLLNPILSAVAIQMIAYSKSKNG